jgi:hypothetical protein
MFDQLSILTKLAIGLMMVLLLPERSGDVVDAKDFAPHL